MKKNKLNIFVLLSTMVILTGTIFAISNKYNPGETLNPQCSPGEVNCTVKIDSWKFIDGANINDAVFTSGNVGIGLNSPTHKLHVRAGDAVGLFESSGNNAYLRLAIQNDINKRIELANRNGRTALWNPNTGDSFSITHSTGNVGIGTINPNAKLEIYGGYMPIRLSGSSWKGIAMDGGSSTKTAFIHYGGDTTNEIRFGRYGDNFGGWEANPFIIDMDAPNNTFKITNNGNIGIGTWNPQKQLHLVGDGNIRLEANSGANSGNYWEINVGNITNKNSLFFDNNTDRGLYMYDGNLYTNSDIRLKKNISNINNYRKILKISPVEYLWKEDNKKDIGFIAQDVQKYFPSFVSKDTKGYLSVAYYKLWVPMLAVLKDHDDELIKQRKITEKLLIKISELEKRLQRVEK